MDEARAAKESKEAEVAAHKATALEQDFARTLREVDKKVSGVGRKKECDAEKKEKEKRKRGITTQRVSCAAA